MRILNLWILLPSAVFFFYFYNLMLARNANMISCWSFLSYSDLHCFQRSHSSVVRKYWTRLRFCDNSESAWDGKKSEISKETWMFLQRFSLEIGERGWGQNSGSLKIRLFMWMCCFWLIFLHKILRSEAKYLPSHWTETNSWSCIKIL